MVVKPSWKVRTSSQQLVRDIVLNKSSKRANATWPDYINADVKSGRKGVSSDGVMPTGTLGTDV